MSWPHTKTLVPAEAGYEIFIEMRKPPLAKHKAAVTTNSVSYIITPPLFGKLHEFCPPEEQNPQIPASTGTSFTNVIYTKLPTFPSRKIQQSRPVTNQEHD